MNAKSIIVGIGGVALAIGGLYGAVKLAQGGHPWMAFLVGAGAGTAGVGLAARSLQSDGTFPFEEPEFFRQDTPATVH
jgi:hypothetical protein